VSLDPRQVEADTARYYDAEGDLRCNRPLDARRVAAREGFLASLEPTRRVLEIGSGPGRDATAFVDAGHDHVAVDLSIEHLRRCARTGALAVQASARHLPFRSNAFDATWTMSTLMHIPDSAIDEALDEIGRVLTPNGALAVGVWGGLDAEEWDERDAGRRLFARRTDERWRSMLDRVGVVETIESWSYEGAADTYQYAVVRSAS
jgi:SAM-dependent methyltransferase